MAQCEEVQEGKESNQVPLSDSAAKMSQEKTKNKEGQDETDHYRVPYSSSVFERSCGKTKEEEVKKEPSGGKIDEEVPDFVDLNYIVENKERFRAECGTTVTFNVILRTLAESPTPSEGYQPYYQDDIFLSVYKISYSASTGQFERTFLTRLTYNAQLTIQITLGAAYQFTVTTNSEKSNFLSGEVIIRSDILKDVNSKTLELKFNPFCRAKLLLDKLESHTDELSEEDDQETLANLVPAKRKAFKLHQKTLVIRNHMLKVAAQERNRVCAVCNVKKVQPLYKCKNCKIAVHAGSVRRIFNECLAITGANKSGASVIEGDKESVKNKIVINLPHNFEEFKTTFKGRSQCSHCGEYIKHLKKASKCTKCNNKYHTKCTQHVPNHCSLSREALAAFQMVSKGTSSNQTGQSETSKTSEQKKEKPRPTTLMMTFLQPLSTDINRSMKIDNLEVIAKVGEGSFGKVFSVIHKGSNLAMACKTISTDFDDEEGFVGLVNEVRVMSLLEDCPFIITLYGCFHVPGYVYVLMNLCPGGDLLNYICARNIKVDTMRTIAAQAILAVNYLHELTIIMRDIKSENFLISWDGVLKMCDFGLAKILNNSQGTCNTFCGTFPYMAPELIVLYDPVVSNLPKHKIVTVPNNGQYSFSVDWWALGLTLYECMTSARLPFDESSEESIVSAVLSKNNFNLNLSDKNLKKMIQSMLEKDFKKRVGFEQK